MEENEFKCDCCEKTVEDTDIYRIMVEKINKDENELIVDKVVSKLTFCKECYASLDKEIFVNKDLSIQFK